MFGKSVLFSGDAAHGLIGLVRKAGGEIVLLIS